MLEKLAWVETIKKDSLAKLKKKKAWIGEDLLQDVFRNNHTPDGGVLDVLLVSDESDGWCPLSCRPGALSPLWVRK